MEKWMVAAKRADFKEIGEHFGIDQVTARIIRNRDVIGRKRLRNICMEAGKISTVHGC